VTPLRSPRRRLVDTTAWAVTVWCVVLFGTFVPIVTGRDSFPLSTYPMFSSPRGETARIDHVLGVAGWGQRRPLPPRLLGSDEIMQAHQTVSLAVRGRTTRALCQRVAQATLEDPAHADIEHIEIRTDTFDTMAYWRGDRQPRMSRVLARCEVERRGPS